MKTWFRKLYPIARDYAMLIIGALLEAVAFNLFLGPNDVVSGGLTGLAQLLRTWIGTPVGLVTLVANIPLLIVGWRRLGGLLFGIRTIVATVVMTLGIDLTAPYLPVITNDPLLYTLYGGLIGGIGAGLVFRARGTTGGVDIIARLLELRYGVRPGRAMLGVDLVVFGVAFFAYGPEKVLYAILVAAVGGVALDYALAAGDGGRQVMIVTNHPEVITHALLHQLVRGVTVLHGQGAFTGQNRTILVSVVARSEVSMVKAIIQQADPEAFVVIGEATEVLGEGFRQLKP